MRIFLALVCCALVGCASKTVTVTGAAGVPSSSTSSASLVPSSPASSYSPPPPEPNPDARYSHSCDYLLGNFQDYSPNGFRFIAEARLNNTGNVGIIVKVTAHWDQVGTRPITMTKTVKLAYGAKGKRVEFTKLVSSNNIDLIQAVSGFNNCGVKAALVKTFGEVHG